ncbi:unnamed protein product [Paramecium pentaurelia]|uniref:Transmembrane protein n=1 Tax=Paramecium pentaurelia TaxID=43138 RepID=A0A8S1SP19_9CILI|nr:unnamed protein product [Paramecium pentaurelia]
MFIDKYLFLKNLIRNLISQNCNVSFNVYYLCIYNSESKRKHIALCQKFNLEVISPLLKCNQQLRVTLQLYWGNVQCISDIRQSQCFFNSLDTPQMLKQNTIIEKISFFRNTLTHNSHIMYKPTQKLLDLLNVTLFNRFLISQTKEDSKLIRYRKRQLVMIQSFCLLLILQQLLLFGFQF